MIRLFSKVRSSFNPARYPDMRFATFLFTLLAAQVHAADSDDVTISPTLNETYFGELLDILKYVPSHSIEQSSNQLMTVGIARTAPQTLPPLRVHLT